MGASLGKSAQYGMELNYFLPRADLQDYVRAYYYFSTSIPGVQPMCAESGNIRILLDGAGRIRFSNGQQSEISTAFILGPTNGAYVLEVGAGTRVFGIGLRPRGWNVMLGINAAETADRVCGFTDFAGRYAGGAIEQIQNAPDLPAMAAAADRFFAELITRRSMRRDKYSTAFEHWLKDPNDLNVDRLVEMMDVSRRQTDRVAKEFFGASPKMLQRKYRALRAADRIRGGERSWFLAAGDGFYDQSHFIKEFKSFIGVTPGQFAASEAKWINAVQAKRLVAPLHHPLASI